MKLTDSTLLLWLGCSHTQPLQEHHTTPNPCELGASCAALADATDNPDSTLSVDDAQATPANTMQDPLRAIERHLVQWLETPCGMEAVHARRPCPERDARCYHDYLAHIDRALCAVYPDPESCALRLRAESEQRFSGEHLFLIVRGPEHPIFITDEQTFREWLGAIDNTERAGMLVAFVENNWPPYGPTCYRTARGYRVERSNRPDAFVDAQGRIQLATETPLYCRPLRAAPHWIRASVGNSNFAPRGEYCETVFGTFTILGTTNVVGGGAARDTRGEVGSPCPAEMSLHPAQVGDTTGSVGIRIWDCPQTMIPHAAQ